MGNRARAVLVVLGLALTASQPTAQSAQQRPESSVSVVNGQLGWGKLVLGMSVTEVENVLAESLVLKPTSDNTSPCRGREAFVETQKQRVTVTFAMPEAGGRLIGIHVPFLSARNLKDVVSALKVQVPALRYESKDGGDEALDTFPLYVLQQDTQQSVLVDAGQALWINRGCRPRPGALAPVARLRARVEAMTGASAVDCGQHLTRQGSRDSVVTADAGTLMRSINCGTIAMRQGRSFWTFQQLRGIDSWVAEGLLSKDGVVYRFFYDDDPSGGSSAAPSFKTERCAKPDAAIERGEARFGCPDRVQLPTTGAIVGRIHDASGGVLPGVTVTVIGPGGAQQAFTSANGTYRITDLEPGTYRADAQLAGFRPAKTDAIVVSADQTTTHDIALRLGILSDVDYAGPKIVTEAVREADVVVHIRVTKAVGTRLVNDSEIVTDYEATVVSVVKADRPTIMPGSLLVFAQDNAGTWREDGQTYIAREPQYSPDDVFIAFLTRRKDSTLARYWGPFYMWPVKQGIVLPGSLAIVKDSGLGTQMPVDEAVAALRKLVAGGQQPKPRPGVLIQGLDEVQADGIVGALRDANVVLHLEITNSLGPRLLRGESIVGTRFVAKAISVVKTDRPITAGSTVAFDQRFAGRFVVDGRPLIGLEQPYETGAYIAFLRRSPDATLEDFAGESYMFPVSKGFVVIPEPGRLAEAGLRRNMPLEECLAALRKLVGR